MDTPGLRPWGTDLWVIESSVRFYGLTIGLRSAVIRLPGDRLFVYSPVAMSPALFNQLAVLGKVSWIVSPNKIHNQTLSAWRLAYPGAALIIPPGLRQRRPRLDFTRELSDRAVEEWAPDLRHLLTGGNRFFSEALFFHEPSGTLLVGDLLENLEKGSLRGAARWAWGLFGVEERPMPSPEFRFYTDSVEAFRDSIRPAHAWRYTRIFLCHGGLIEQEARWTFERACEELCAAVQNRSPLRQKLLNAMARLQ